jgi:hypothetical protein
LIIFYFLYQLYLILFDLKIGRDCSWLENPFLNENLGFVDELILDFVVDQLDFAIKPLDFLV